MPLSFVIPHFALLLVGCSSICTFHGPSQAWPGERETHSDLRDAVTCPVALQPHFAVSPIRTVRSPPLTHLDISTESEDILEYLLKPSSSNLRTRPSSLLRDDPEDLEGVTALPRFRLEGVGDLEKVRFSDDLRINAASRSRVFRHSSSLNYL
ncbi:hypothetical protein K469DRAFT_754675, partial [Zopfia rhizophila CBS 207.26]